MKTPFLILPEDIG